MNFWIILFQLSADLFDCSSINSNWKKLVKLIRWSIFDNILYFCCKNLHDHSRFFTEKHNFYVFKYLVYMQCTIVFFFEWLLYLLECIFQFLKIDFSYFFISARGIFIYLFFLYKIFKWLHTEKSNEFKFKNRSDYALVSSKHSIMYLSTYFYLNTHELDIANRLSIMQINYNLIFHRRRIIL